jgi:hypothetical protein
VANIQEQTMTDSASSLVTAGMVTGLFTDKESAERAFRSATAFGYESSDIDVIMSEDTRNQYFAAGHDTNTGLSDKATQDSSKDPPSADEVGGPIGGTAFTLAPALAAAGTVLLIPGLGIVAAGPIAVALAAAGAIGLAGAFIGALTKWGIPARRIEEYEQGIREGGILVGVKPRDAVDASLLVREWQANGGKLVHS